MQNIYIDTNVLITILNNEPLLIKAVAILEQATVKKVNLYSSMLSYGEVLYIDKQYWGKAVNFLDTIPITYIDINKDIIVAAAHIREDHSIKLPDAIHVASAKYAFCDLFISQDKALLKISNKFVKSVNLKDYNL